MRLRILLSLALIFSLGVTARAQSSPYSNVIFKAQTFTATGQTGTPIQLNGLVVASTVGSSFASGTITVTGSSLTTVTFGLQGSSDGGATYYALPVSTVASPTTTPTTTITATGNGLYQVNLAGLTHVRFVTSGTFTATNVSLTLTASPNASLSKSNGSGGGPPTGAAGGALSGTYPNPGIATVNSGSGLCGDATHVCQVTTNPAGQTTSQASVAIASSGGTSNPATCTVNSASDICITLAPYYASGSGLTTTTTSATFGVGTSGSVASCSTFSASNGVLITGAGAAGVNYIGTVVSCSGTTLTVTPATSTSVASGILVQHDETAAFQAAITATGASGNGTIYVPNGVYLINGALQDTSGANAILTMPHSAAYSGPAIGIAIKGFVPPSQEGGSTGAILQTNAPSGNLIAGFYNIGAFEPFTQVYLNLENLTFRSYINPGVVMVNATNIVGTKLTNVFFDTGTTSPSVPANTAGAGFVGPTDSNSAFVTLSSVMAAGYYHGLQLGEHTTATAIQGDHDHDCFVFNVGGAGPDAQGITLVHPWAQQCVNQFTWAGTQPIDAQIIDADIERPSGLGINDPSNLALGSLTYHVGYAAGAVTVYDPAINGAANLHITNLRYPKIAFNSGSGGLSGVLNWFNNSTTQDVSLSHPSTGNLSLDTTAAGNHLGNLTMNNLTVASCTGCASGVLNGTVTYTTSQSATTSDNGKLVIMNCSGACSYTLPATQPSTTWAAEVVSQGSTTATIGLGGSDTYNGTTSAPALNKFEPLWMWSDSATATAYRGQIPTVAGANMTVTPSSNGMSLASTAAGGSGTSVTVNGGTALTTAALNAATPAAPSGNTNVTWQVSGNNVTAYVPQTPTFFPYTFAAEVTGTTNTTPAVSVTAGQLLVVGCRFGPGNTAAAATDSASDTFTALTAQNESTSGSGMQISWAIASTTASTTFTCTQATSGVALAVIAMRFSGTGTTANTSAGAVISTTATAYSTGAFTTSQRTLDIACVAVGSASSAVLPQYIGGHPATLIGQDQASLASGASEGCEAVIVPYAVQGAASMNYAVAAKAAISVLAFNY